jgi:hypothetical protein
MAPEDVLGEYRAAVKKIDDAVATLQARAGSAIRCERGCSSCCVDGLTVLPVEAAAIRAANVAPPAVPAPGMCAFLSMEGSCSIYPVRPLLCRTHGLPLLMPPDTSSAAVSSGLRIIDDVSVCALNFTERAPQKNEILDARAVMMLLTTVDTRYADRVHLPSTARERTPLRTLAHELKPSASG